MMKFAMIVLVALALASPASASHFNSINVAADCDGFQFDGNIRIAVYMDGRADLSYTVQVLNDGVLQQEQTGIVPVELDYAGFPFEVSGNFAEPLSGVNEVSFHFFFPDSLYGNLDEIHTTTVECADTQVQTRLPRYWYRHPGQWPVQELEIGGTMMPKSQVRRLMVNCWRHRVVRNLFRHTVAAKLNLLNGAVGDIDAALIDADAFLASHHRHQRLCRSDRRLARSIKNTLREFNRRDHNNKTIEYDKTWDESEIDESSLGEVKALFR